MIPDYKNFTHAVFPDEKFMEDVVWRYLGSEAKVYYKRPWWQKMLLRWYKGYCDRQRKDFEEQIKKLDIRNNL